MVQHHFDKQGGYATLVAVLVLGAVGAAVSTSLLLTGLGSSQSSFSVEQSVKAQSLANTCAEEGLQQIHDATSFSGSGSLSLGGAACEYVVILGVGQNRTVQASGTVGSVVRKVLVNVDTVNPQINVTSWQGVSDF